MMYITIAIMALIALAWFVHSLSKPPLEDNFDEEEEEDPTTTFWHE